MMLKQSLYMPGKTQKCLEVEAHEGGKVASTTHRPPLPTRKYSFYLFLLEAESTPGAQWRWKDYVTDPIGDRTRELPACNAVPPTTASRHVASK